MIAMDSVARSLGLEKFPRNFHRAIFSAYNLIVQLIDSGGRLIVLMNEVNVNGRLSGVEIHACKYPRAFPSSANGT